MTVPTFVAIGFSSGGFPVVSDILAGLPDPCGAAVGVVAHMPPGSAAFASVMASKTHVAVREAEDKLPITPGVVHTAPGGFHLLVEDRGHFALSLDHRVSHSRPSVTVLLESASAAFGPDLVAVILGGANDDGAAALPTVRRRGGRVLVQSPQSAMFPQMPLAAIDACVDIEVLPPVQLSHRLHEILSCRPAPQS